jgi:hypothetical protein
MRTRLALVVLLSGIFMMVSGAIVYTGNHDITFWLGLVMAIVGYEIWRFQRF